MRRRRSGTRRPRPRPLSSRWWLLSWLCAVACATFVPRQGWNPSFGPVVPHDSFPADCSLCHEGDDWHTLRADFTFDHERETGVPLRGAHADAGCLLCHNDRGPVQQFAARGCGGCHGDPHLTRLGANCEHCHGERTWYPHEAIVQHDRTRFPLVGAHAAAACFRCHPGAQVGNFAGATSVCSDCHADAYARTANPNHAQVGFSRQCEQCHLPLAWQPARFDHPASFPLQNGHAGRACAACHTTPGVFTGLSTDCASCHLDDFAATSEPNHAAAGFATRCDECHDTRTFRRADWPHPGGFALTLGHAGRRCSECHQGQVFATTSSACASCHLDDFQATQNPPHAAFQLSLECQQCHGTAAWGAGNWQHAFPIQGGRHGGLSCFACHDNPSNQQAFNCIGCHDHRQSEMDDEHDDVPAYVWATAACYQCHPTGRR